MACFLSTRSQNTAFWSILLKKKKEENLSFLTKKYGLTPLENCKIFDFSKWIFSKMASFLYKRPRNTFFWPFFAEKEKRTKFFIFDQKPCTNPFKKNTKL